MNTWEDVRNHNIKEAGERAGEIANMLDHHGFEVTLWDAALDYQFHFQRGGIHYKLVIRKDANPGHTADRMLSMQNLIREKFQAIHFGATTVGDEFLAWRTTSNTMTLGEMVWMADSVGCEIPLNEGVYLQTTGHVLRKPKGK